MEHDQMTLDSGLSLGITRAGTGAVPVLLVHGWSCRRNHWQALLAEPPANTSLLAVDLPGHGDSSGTDAPAWTIEAMGAVVAEVTDEMPGRPVLVGHSMGGAVSMEAARQLDDPAGLLLVDTFVIPYGDLDEETARSIEAPFHEDFVAAMDNLVENNAGAAISEAGKVALKTDMAGARIDAMLPLWHDLLRWSPEPAFAEIRCPIHAINGDLIPEPAKQRCRGRVEEWLMPGAGHFPQQEMPETFARRFAEVLDQIV